LPSVDTRLAFAQQHWTTKEGDRFSLKGRQWVVDEFWRPACGFKLWPLDKERLCSECSAKAGVIQDYNHKHAPHQHPLCAGLSQEPIIVTVLDLPRRSGKTFNALGFGAASILTSKNEYITYIASAEDQTETLFNENMAQPIRNNPVLDALCYIANMKVTVATTKSKFECLPTSKKSITGRGRTMVIIDEARDVPAETAAKLIPSIFAESGWECPVGHIHVKGKPKNLLCSVCNIQLQPWFGRLIIESSSGLIVGNENDWFAELVASLTEEPHPNFHLYSTSEIINPRVSKMTVGAITDVFGRQDMPAMRHYIDVEVNNVSRRKGDDFLSKAEIEKVVNTRLGNTEGTTDPCVAFLDVSSTVDKTSLVILAARDPKWDRCYVARIDYWEPQKLPNGLIDEVMILDHLDRYLPMFPGLASFGVDTRMMPWAQHMVKVIKQSGTRGWAKKTDAFNGGPDERNASWSCLENRVLACSIELPPHPELRKELLAVQRIQNLNNQTEIRDRSRRKRHADIADALAECCRRAFLQQTKSRVSLGMVNKGVRPGTSRPQSPSSYKPITNHRMDL
jgi:hypothetical protein